MKIYMAKAKSLEWLFDVAIDCSSKAMYPDFLSLTGDGYILRCIRSTEKLSV